MDFNAIILISLLVFVGFYYIVSGFNIKLMVGYMSVVDIAISLAVLLFFSSGITSLLIGAFVGLWMSFFFRAYRNQYGFMRFDQIKRKTQFPFFEATYRTWRPRNPSFKFWR